MIEQWYQQLDSDNEDFVNSEEDIEPTRPILIYPNAKSTIVEEALKNNDFLGPIAKVTDDNKDVEEDDLNDVVLEQGSSE